MCLFIFIIRCIKYKCFSYGYINLDVLFVLLYYYFVVPGIPGTVQVLYCTVAK